MPVEVPRMPIVKIDDTGRMTVLKEIGARNTRAIIIPVGSFLSRYSLLRVNCKHKTGYRAQKATENYLKKQRHWCGKTRLIELKGDSSFDTSKAQKWGLTYFAIRNPTAKPMMNPMPSGRIPISNVPYCTTTGPYLSTRPDMDAVLKLT